MFINLVGTFTSKTYFIYSSFLNCEKKEKIISNMNSLLQSYPKLTSSYSDNSTPIFTIKSIFYDYNVYCSSNIEVIHRSSKELISSFPLKAVSESKDDATIIKDLLFVVEKVDALIITIESSRFLYTRYF